MLEFDRVSVRREICEILRGNYIALLGQQDAELEAIIQHFVNKRSPLVGMQFLAISLPQGQAFRDVDEFEKLFLDRLLNAISRSFLQSSVKNSVHESALLVRSLSAHSQIRTALDVLGRKMTSGYLVITLHGLRDIAEGSLKNLLTIFRDYRDQINIQGAEGERLRFLVAGGADLWTFCSDRSPERSPFNIARCFFLDGLSVDELIGLDIKKSVSDATELRGLTDGVPSLVRAVISQSVDQQDLSVYFSILQKAWKALSSQSRDILCTVVSEIVALPECQPDGDCPPIPSLEEEEEIWTEVFWSGFLRMGYRQLAWRSPIHLAFVCQFTDRPGRSQKTFFVQVDMQERVKHLKAALHEKQYEANRREIWRETKDLAIRTLSDELLPVFEMLQRGEEPFAIQRELRNILICSERPWMKDLAQELLRGKQEPGEVLVKNIASRVDYLQSTIFDIFLCHNSNDKDEIKGIAGLLMQHGLRPWLDEWELPPGRSWQPLLEQQILQVRSAAVFIGRYGMGSWQQEELDALLLSSRKKGYPVIPVFLKDAPSNVLFPPFLQSRTSVDFRKNKPDPLEMLIRGIPSQGEPMGDAKSASYHHESSQLPRSVKILYLYAPEDESLLLQLEKHLTPMTRASLIENRHRGRLMPGQSISQEMKHYLDTSDVIVLLMSPAFVASNDVYEFSQKALEKWKAGNVRIVPILLRPFLQSWSGFEGLQALPKNGKPISTWSDSDKAFVEVAQGIQMVAEAVLYAC